MHVIDTIIKNVDQKMNTEYKTGPVVIFNTYNQYKNSDGAQSITLLPQSN